MRLVAENFGPIEKVEIEINPLTILIGKNNIGKSYLAQLYYSVLDTTKVILESSYRFRRYAMLYRERYLDVSYGRPFYHYRPFPIDLRSVTKTINKDTPDSMVVQDILEMILANLASDIETPLRLSLEKTFAVKINKLVSIYSNEALLSWDMFEHIGFKVQITKQGSLKARPQLLESGTKLIEEFRKVNSSSIERLKRARTRKESRFWRIYLLLEQELLEIKKNIKPEFNWNVLVPRERSFFYMPAGRGGLVESYETVVGGLISLSPVAPVRGLSMPPLPGTAALFYQVLLKLEGKRGPLSKEVSRAFTELFEGEIRLQKVKGQAKSRLIYEFAKGENASSTDVIHAASMIKELAPIYLIIRELVRPGDFLIIEEPESHLHPGAQVKLVNIIGSLVNNGIKVLFTTHSDLLLRATGFLIGEKVQKMALLERRNISIYWLKNGHNGCISEEVKLSDYGTISDIPTFDEVVDDLYDREVKLEKTALGSE
jgi:predicted ATPase